MNRFENKVILITGAASGIGAASVRRLTNEGGKVIIADYDKDKAGQLANELTEAGADVRAVYFTADQLDSCRKLVSLAYGAYGRIDCLVNNVGGSKLQRDSNIQHLDIEYFDEVFHINLRCAVYLTQLVIPIMKRIFAVMQSLPALF